MRFFLTIIIFFPFFWGKRHGKILNLQKMAAAIPQEIRVLGGRPSGNVLMESARESIISRLVMNTELDSRVWLSQFESKKLVFDREILGGGWKLGFLIWSGRWKATAIWSRRCKMGGCTGSSIRSSSLIFATAISLRQATIFKDRIRVFCFVLAPGCLKMIVFNVEGKMGNDGEWCVPFRLTRVKFGTFWYLGKWGWSITKAASKLFFNLR